eukprot:3912561-Rhodomonas_salina.1
MTASYSAVIFCKTHSLSNSSLIAARSSPSAQAILVNPPSPEYVTALENASFDWKGARSMPGKCGGGNVDGLMLNERNFFQQPGRLTKTCEVRNLSVPARETSE